MIISVNNEYVLYQKHIITKLMRRFLIYYVWEEVVNIFMGIDAIYMCRHTETRSS